MLDTINHFASYLEKASFLSYPISIFLGFLAGVAAITCFIPIVPMVMGFTGGRDITRRKLLVIPICITLGSVIILGILGIVVSFAGLGLQKQLGSYWPYLIAAVCFIVGLLELGVIKTGLKFPEFKSYKGFWSPMLFGIVAGGTIGIGSTCCVPTLPIVLAYAGIRGNPIHGAAVLTMFAIGQSVPVFAIGLFSSALGKITAKWSFYVRRVAGILLIAIAVYLVGGRFYGTKSAVSQPESLVSLTDDSQLESNLTPAKKASQPTDVTSAQQLESNPSPGQTGSLNWHENLNKLSQQNKFAFLFIDKGESSEGQALRTVFQNVAGKHANKVDLIEVDFTKDQQGLEKFYNIAFQKLPAVLVVAPNGAITGGFGTGVSQEQAEQSLVSSVEAGLIRSVQKGNVVFLCLHNGQSDNLEKVKAELGAIETLFKGAGVALYLNTNDTSVLPFTKKLPPFSTDSTTVFTVVPPGRIISRFEGQQITRANLLQAFQSSCGAGCGPSGCGPR